MGQPLVTTKLNFGLFGLQLVEHGPVWKDKEVDALSDVKWGGPVWKDKKVDALSDVKWGATLHIQQYIY